MCLISVGMESDFLNQESSVSSIKNYFYEKVHDISDKGSRYWSEDNVEENFLEVGKFIREQNYSSKHARMPLLSKVKVVS